MFEKNLSRPRGAARRRHLSRPQRAFTLIEVLVVVAIIALLVAILLPSLRRARDQSLKVVCGSNLSQIGKGLHIYVHDSKGHLPPLYRTPTSFTTYYMFNPGINNPRDGRVSLGCLAKKRYVDEAHLYYCPTQNREDSASLAYDGKDNAWNGDKLSPQKPVRSSYLARLIEVQRQNTQIGGTPKMEPMPAGEPVTDWKLDDYHQQVIYSDFTGTDGFQGGGIITGRVWLPHRRRGVNKLYGDSSVLWTRPDLLEEYRPITEVAPTPEEMVEYWKLLDRGH